jgi:MOSC domain-containing protein YiiM
MADMRLVSVNVGKKQTQLKGNELETTGIYKLPAAGMVEIGVPGLMGDFICDQESHGGLDQAVYIYGTTDYSWWKARLGTEIEPGAFGENLTISDLESATISVGDRLQVGDVLLEVTAPRIPCSTLAARMHDPEFVKRYRYGERPGLYCRVIEAGAVQAGDEVKLLPYAGETVSVLEMFRNHYLRTKDEATLRRFLRAPISIRARVSAERDLRKIAAAAIEWD